MIDLEQVLLRFVIGGTLTVVLYLLSRSPYPFMAAVFSAFPLMITIGLYQLNEALPKPEVYRLTALLLFNTLALVLFVYVFRQQILKTGFWLAWITGITAWILASIAAYYIS